MAEFTENYNLTCPDETSDYYDVNVQNGNMTIIDEELKKQSDKTTLVPLFTSESGISSGDISLSKPYTDFKRLIFVYYFNGQESKEVFVDELGNQSILLRALNLVDSPTAPNPGAVTFFEMKVTVANVQQLTIVSSANVTHDGETVVRDDPSSALVGTILSVYGSYI